MGLIRLVAVSLIIAALCGCDYDQRLATLEKQTKDLQQEVKSNRAAGAYDLSEKCARASKAWFQANWQPDKDTILLDYTNHYNQKLNKCFITVEYHYNTRGGPRDLWTNNMSLWDVNENAKYADFVENHYFNPKANPMATSEVVICEVTQTKCASIDEFNRMTSSYMED